MRDPAATEFGAFGELFESFGGFESFRFLAEVKAVRFRVLKVWRVRVWWLWVVGVLRVVRFRAAHFSS